MDEAKRKEYIEIIKHLRLMDDDFMTKCFEDNPECTELVIRTILGKNDLRVLSATTQYTVMNLQGRSVRFDIKATDSDGMEYDIEIQRTRDGAGKKRARHNSSMLDANFLQPRQDVEDLPESYVIFITEKDFLGGGKPIYFIDRYIRTDGNPLIVFGDGSHIIYVNGECKDETPLGKLMHDFFCTRAEDMHYEVLKNRVRYFKDTEEGVSQMCEIWEKIRNDGIAEGMKKGREAGRMEGMKEGVEEGRRDTIIDSIRNVMNSLDVSVQRAMEILNVSPAEYEKYNRLVAVNG